MITADDVRHYYECHVTVEPLHEGQQARRFEFEKICSEHKFKSATFIMDKATQADPKLADAFCTGRRHNYQAALNDTHQLVLALKAAAFTVKRYKIEATCLDSRIEDELHLL